jgi:hypothetical protein
MIRLGFGLAALAACAAQPAHDGDVVGPFTGPTHRFAVDAITLAKNNFEARAFGADLDGDRYADNQLGMALGTLASQELISPHANALIAAGAIASSVTIQADDLDDDATVKAVYLGADGAPAVHVGGRLERGVFLSNRTAITRVPGSALLHLPVFADADPSVVPVFGMQLELAPDGAGGYDGLLQGMMHPSDVLPAVARGLDQLVSARPRAYRSLMNLLDGDRDWTLSQGDVATNALMMSLLTPDVMLDGEDVLSIGFAFHLRPCADGSCQEAIAPSCFDRVRNGDETDVDCGGSCGACAAGLVCAQASDCDSRACTTSGTCAAPTCSDGIGDGFESDVDCGGPCGGCALGQRCWSSRDCGDGLRCGPSCSGLGCQVGYKTCEADSSGS